MGIPAGTRVYLCPTHDLAGRVWILSMDIKVYPYPAHVSTVPAGTCTRGKIAILIVLKRSIEMVGIYLDVCGVRV
jgi:hypothetical protein